MYIKFTRFWRCVAAFSAGVVVGCAVYVQGYGAWFWFVVSLVLLPVAISYWMVRYAVCVSMLANCGVVAGILFQNIIFYRQHSFLLWRQLASDAPLIAIEIGFGLATAWTFSVLSRRVGAGRLSKQA